MSVFKHIKALYPKSTTKERTQLIRALWFLLAFTVFSGAIRKWIFGGGGVGNAILLLQLFVPLVFYSVVLRNKMSQLRATPLIWLIYIFYLALTAINPMNHTIFHGIFGVILHTGYFLFWLAYLQKGKWMELEKLVPLFLVILAIEFVLAILQYALPGTHILNIQASGDANNAIVGEAVRVSGTYSYIGGFAVMVPMFACLAWFMLLRNYAISIVLVVLVSGLIMALMSGSRGAVGYYLLYTAMAFLFSGNLFGRVFKLVAQGIMMISLVVIFLPKAQELVLESYDNFLYRVENTDQVDERLAGSYSQIFDFKGKYPVFGVGLGATYQGANALFGKSIFVQEYGGYENELGRIVLEGGFVLFFLRFILVLVFFKQTTYLPILVKGVLLIIFFNSMMTFNIYQGIFYVLGIMLIDRGYYLKQQEEQPSTASKISNR